MLIINNDEILFRKYITGNELIALQNNFKNTFGNYITQSDVDKIECKIIKINKNCWNYNQCMNQGGYYQTHFHYKTVLIHRMIYQLNHPTENIKNKVIRHVCDNTECVNYQHLVSGSNDDNMRDMVERERQCKGSNMNTARLTEFEVEQILQEILSDKYKTVMEISKQLNINKNIIYGILKGQTWKHISKKYDLNILKQKIKDYDSEVRKQKYGENNNFHKLLENDVKDIKQRLKNGEMIKNIAKLYNVGTTAIGNIKFNRTWKHIV